MDAFETIAEKTALAERFGLRIPYLTMNKKEYLSLVDQLADLEGLEMNREMTEEAQRLQKIEREIDDYLNNI